ncbi:transposase [Paraburkholderia youngii]|uniref:transposase n=1 Tax=Paraburkholderia youngii TaxID=2782701 RepID=UPI003D1CDD59
MSNESSQARRTHRVYPLEFKQQVVRETLEPGASVSVIARRHDVNANIVFEWKRLYREGKLTLPGTDATSTSPAELLPINVIDLPMQHLSQPTANEPPKAIDSGPSPVCEVEIESVRATL